MIKLRSTAEINKNQTIKTQQIIIEKGELFFSFTKIGINDKARIGARKTIDSCKYSAGTEIIKTRKRLFNDLVRKRIR
jgi:hypothetical protein